MSRKVRVIDGKQYVWVRDALEELGLAPTNSIFTTHPRKTILFPGPNTTRNLRYVLVERLDEEIAKQAKAKEVETIEEDTAFDTPTPTTTDISATAVMRTLFTLVTRQEVLRREVMQTLAALEAKIDNLPRAVPPLLSNEDLRVIVKGVSENVSENVLNAMTAPDKKAA